MKELGIFAPSGHLSVAKALLETADHILLVGPLTKRFILPYLDKHNKKFASILWFEDVHQLVDHLLANLPENALICFKGSQNLEEVIKSVLFDSKDIGKLCRQELFWEESKKKNGVWIEVT
jgi:UDP-N-acetylmuramyl pentapeptide synthase